MADQRAGRGQQGGGFGAWSAGPVPRIAARGRLRRVLAIRATGSARTPPQGGGWRAPARRPPKG